MKLIAPGINSSKGKIFSINLDKKSRPINDFFAGSVGFSKFMHAREGSTKLFFEIDGRPFAVRKAGKGKLEAFPSKRVRPGYEAFKFVVASFFVEPLPEDIMKYDALRLLVGKTPIVHGPIDDRFQARVLLEHATLKEQDSRAIKREISGYNDKLLEKKLKTL